MMTNYSQWHTERSPTCKKVNSAEEISSLNEKVNLIMSMLTKQVHIDPRGIPLNCLVAQEKEQIVVNFISWNNFNNTAYRSNFGGKNPRSIPTNNSYGNPYSHTPNYRGLPSYEKLI